LIQKKAGTTEWSPVHIASNSHMGKWT
jgi:hypothetical protein